MPETLEFSDKTQGQQPTRQLDSTIGCFHCGLPLPSGTYYPVEIDSEERNMCCAGCQAVAQAIVDNKLTDFYRYRSEKTAKADEPVPEALRELSVYDDEVLQQSFVRVEAKNQREASLILEGIVCAACIWLNERHVKSLPGVLDFRVNYSTHRAHVKWDTGQLKLSDILAAIQAIGYHAHPFDPSRQEALQKKEKAQALRRVAIAGAGMMQLMMISVALYLGEHNGISEGLRHFLRWASLIITIPVLVYASSVFFKSAWRDLRRKQAGMDVPVALAMGAAFSASVWATLTQSGEIYFDSVVMFTFFLLTGRYLEMMARHKAGQVAEELVRLLPATATRLENAKDDEQQQIVSVSDLQQGDRVLIRPGETIPADGLVLEGYSSVDESLLTGESLPRDKQAQDTLTGGTVNIESPLVMSVQKVGQSTVLSSITRLLERAQSEKPNLARLADRIAAWFVLGLLIIASLVFSAWYVLEPEQAFWITLSVLVVTCPCALSLATPAALTAATGSLTQKGVLTTRGHALETLAQINHVIFDKTGTLTQGRLQLMDTQLIDNPCCRHLSQTECQHIAAALEQASEHPVAQALCELGKDHYERIVFSDMHAVSGKGVEGFYQNQRWRIGTAAYVKALSTKPFVQTEDKLEAGTTRVYLGNETGGVAMFILRDELRAEAVEAVQSLKKQGIRVSLLSGDLAATVDNVAQTLQLDQAQGECLPADKLAYVKKQQQQGEIVAMVGDGVNDAPVLAQAQVSIAMGSGSQLAHASADMVLLSENLHHLPESIQTAKRMMRIIRQNFFWAIAYNASAIPLAAMGLIAPWMAAIGMSASSLIVVLNALRLK